jgi:hypothetical protein
MATARSRKARGMARSTARSVGRTISPITSKAASGAARREQNAATRRASARAKGRERGQALRTLRFSLEQPGPILEGGVGLGNVVRGIARIVGSRAGSSATKKAAPAAKKTVSTYKDLGGSRNTTRQGFSAQGEFLTRSGNPKKFGPAKPRLTPGQKGAQTRAMNKWEAEQRAAKRAAARKKGAEGPKATSTSKTTKPKMSKKKKAAIGAGVGAGVGTLAYATYPRAGAEGPKKNKVTTKSGQIRFRK